MFDSTALKKWFICSQRDFPWRQQRDPYRVWVSEMMLQQTQASVVVPYFERWMERFPSIKHLAEASLDEVIKVWEGLGYYSRARYLHSGARYLMEYHHGCFPEDPKEMQKIKGLGPYTIGAIRSFAFHHKTVAVDGNVQRVLARFFCVESDFSKSSTIKQIHAHASNLLPDKEPWVVNEALIELGATICTKKPQCGKCPLRANCLAYAHGKVADLPFKSKKTKIQPLYRAVAVIKCGSHWLVRRGNQGEIMHDLHEFPYFEITEEGMPPAQLKAEIKKAFGLSVNYEIAFSEITHSFTRYRVRLWPMIFVAKELSEIPQYQWMTTSEMAKVAFSSGHRKILMDIGDLGT